MKNKHTEKENKKNSHRYMYTWSKCGRIDPKGHVSILRTNCINPLFNITGHFLQTKLKTWMQSGWLEPKLNV